MFIVFYLCFFYSFCIYIFICEYVVCIYVYILFWEVFYEGNYCLIYFCIFEDGVDMDYFLKGRFLLKFFEEIILFFFLY